MRHAHIEAQKDALYVTRLCEEMGIKYFVRSIDVPKYCQENKLSIEDGARKLRYEMFFEIMQRTHANKIAIAHNVNDQAETILMFNLGENFVSKINGTFDDAILYLAHLNAPDKAQYDVKDIMLFLRFQV